MKKETCIYPPRVLRAEIAGGELKEVEYECYTQALRYKKVGDRVTHYAGAPGTGSITYRITRIDETGVWGVVVRNTIRELRPSEVY